MKKSQTDTTINSPLNEVADYVFNLENSNEWLQNVNSVDWLTPPPAKVGAYLNFKTKFMGKERKYTFKVVENVPEKKLKIKRDIPFKLITTYFLEGLDEKSTKIIIRTQFELKGWMLMLVPINLFIIKSSQRKDLEKLKSILESR